MGFEPSKKLKIDEPYLDKALQDSFSVIRGLANECPAHGEGHYYVIEEVPSEFITGIAGGTEFVYQCKWCGKAQGGF